MAGKTLGLTSLLFQAYPIGVQHHGQMQLHRVCFELWPASIKTSEPDWANNPLAFLEYIQDRNHSIISESGAQPDSIRLMIVYVAAVLSAYGSVNTSAVSSRC